MKLEEMIKKRDAMKIQLDILDEKVSKALAEYEEMYTDFQNLEDDIFYATEDLKKAEEDYEIAKRRLEALKGGK
jgi:chromosome segregation ATPase